MKIIDNYIFCILILVNSNMFAQENLEYLLEPIPQNNTVINTFKSTRIVNSHSVEIFEKKQLDLRISHRFGLLNTGFYELFGLDQAKTRIGLEYGVMQKLMIGLGRSTFNKTYDGFLKYVLVQQNNAKNKMPFSLVYFSSVGINSLKKSQINYPFLGRLSFSNQFLLASKVNSKLSLQIMPSLIHWNMVDTKSQSNSIFVLGGGFRYLISKSVSINSEYFYRFYDENDYFNSLSFGFDIETGGHVFQLHITNSIGMDESSFLTRTSNSWSNGGVHFGFNISREFSL